ncbi:hypothetical protein [Nonlabens sp. Asnod3-A02]
MKMRLGWRDFEMYSLSRKRNTYQKSNLTKKPSLIEMAFSRFSKFESNL